MFTRTWAGIEASSNSGDNGFVCRDESHDASDHGNSNSIYGRNVAETSQSDPRDHPRTGGFRPEATSKFGRGAFDAMEMQRL